MNIVLKKSRHSSQKLLLSYGHDAIYYLRDIEYIIRIIPKLSKELKRKKRDIDWLQSIIETFLILNSRFYDDLILDLVKNIRRYHTLPDGYSVKKKLDEYGYTLSMQYHEERTHNRHLAAHSSNYQRIGIPEFGNDVLPMPMRYTTTMSLPRMAKRKDLIKMWQNDMNQCADDLNAIFEAVKIELNTFKNLPTLDPHQSDEQ